MAANGATFVEWKEDYVSQERGNRIVHYILKDSTGKSVRAVIGTERSLRHMVYVVADEFLEYTGTENPAQAGFKWRSRREVVDWLTSMLAKQHQSDSPRGDAMESLGSSDLFSAPQFSLPDKMDHRARSLKQSYSDIVWLGAPWSCGKQLKHYPSFRRNGTTIAVQSFVFVMAKEENRYVAYLEDMYEDKKGQKKVRVRWFHHSQEVKGVVRLRNAHPKEVYITPYTQVISVECVVGPAIVLTREHFDKCIGTFPDGLMSKVHLCIRQFRSNKIKPFDLSKLRGYFDQAVISFLESNTFPNSDSMFCGITGNGVNVFNSRVSGGKGTKRSRNSGDQESFLTAHTGINGNGRKKFIRVPRKCNSDMYDKGLLFKTVECQRLHTQFFNVDDKIELLCQDSGIRGCWFRCTVLEISRKQMKVRYNDLEDQDGCGNLEEWVPAFRQAAADKLGMRCLERPTIRPSPPSSNLTDTEFVIGAPLDAWWSDGWWEGVVTAIEAGGNLQVYLPGENIFLNVQAKNVRISRDWVGGQWVDVKTKLDILSVVAPETKPPIASIPEEVCNEDSALKTEVAGDENREAETPAPASPEDRPEQVSSPVKDDLKDTDHVSERKDTDHVSERSDDVSAQDLCCDHDVANVNDDDGRNGTADVDAHDDQNIANGEINGQRVGESDEENRKITTETEVAA